MSTGLLLDVSFGIIALLFLAIGYRRGLLREAFVTAGVLAGAQFSASWARPWGSDLAEAIDIRTGMGRFAVSAAMLIGATVVLGYGGSAAARVGEPLRWPRIAGAALAVINGGLLTAFLLRDIERFLADDATERALARSRVASTLLRDFGWVLIGMGALCALAIAIGMLRGDRRDAPLLTKPAPAAWEPPPLPAAPRRPRLPWGSDEGKVEPAARAFDPASGKFAVDAPSARATMPIVPAAPAAERAGGWGGDRSEWLEIVPRERAGWAPRAAEPEPPTGIRCPGCGEPLSDDDMFCPRCGRARAVGR